jgi:hypothetical protein
MSDSSWKSWSDDEHRRQRHRTDPGIPLSQTNRLAAQLFGTIVPSAVANELTYPNPSFQPIDLSIMPFVEIRAPQDRQRVAHYAATLIAVRLRQSHWQSNSERCCLSTKSTVGR